MASLGVWREGAAAAFILLVQTSAFAQGTDQERQACMPDVFRLCGAYIPDVDRITSCLRGSGPRLSSACHDVFFPPQEVPLTRSLGPPRRPGALPPQDDED
jgi:hypothetical protein